MNIDLPDYCRRYLRFKYLSRWRRRKNPFWNRVRPRAVLVLFAADVFLRVLA